jgi:hypothetical protein
MHHDSAAQQASSFFNKWHLNVEMLNEIAPAHRHHLHCLHTISKLPGFSGGIRLFTCKLINKAIAGRLKPRSEAVPSDPCYLADKHILNDPRS